MYNVHTFVSELHRRLFKYFTYKITLEYIPVLDDFVKSYNSRPHRSLNYSAPNDVTKENEQKFWKLQFHDRNKQVKPYTISNYKLKKQPNTKVYKIKKINGIEILVPLQRGKPRFKIDQRVRILKWNEKFRKGYIQSFSDSVYRIKNVLDTWPYTYTVYEEITKEPVEGIFYKEELIGIEKEKKEKI